MKYIAGLVSIATIVALLAVYALPIRANAEDQPSKRSKLQGTIIIDGSSTVYPITEAVAEEFIKQNRRVRVPVGVSGTGGGFKRFVKGETDISNASRTIKPAEYDLCNEKGIEFIEIPVAFDGLSFVVNPANTWVDHLTLDEIRQIFLDDTAPDLWSDVRPHWPDRPIEIYAPGTDSGTFDYFKEVVAGDDKSIRADISVSEDDNVLVTGVSGSENAIGFFGVAYYEENKDKLRVVPIDAGEGPIEPTPRAIEEGTYAPFSRPLFIYVNAESLERPIVEAFVRFYIENAGPLANEVGYVRLPSEIYDRARDNVEARVTGTYYLDRDSKPRKGSLRQLYR